MNLADFPAELCQLILNACTPRAARKLRQTARAFSALRLCAGQRVNCGDPLCPHYDLRCYFLTYLRLGLIRAKNDENVIGIDPRTDDMADGESIPRTMGALALWESGLYGYPTIPRTSSIVLHLMYKCADNPHEKMPRLYRRMAACDLLDDSELSSKVRERVIMFVTTRDFPIATWLSCLMMFQVWPLRYNVTGRYGCETIGIWSDVLLMRQLFSIKIDRKEKPATAQYAPFAGHLALYRQMFEIEAQADELILSAPVMRLMAIPAFTLAPDIFTYTTRDDKIHYFDRSRLNAIM